MEHTKQKPEKTYKRMYICFVRWRGSGSKFERIQIDSSRPKKDLIKFLKKRCNYELACSPTIKTDLI